VEGPAWTRWRAVGRDIYRTVGGYVTGNLLISVIAGSTSGAVLAIFGVPYPVALGVIVGFLDLIPLVGATLALVIVGGVALLHSLEAAIAIVVYAIVYQQIENQLLQPLIYGKTVQLSPLAVLIAVLIGGTLGGILRALLAIPLAGAIQVLLVDWRRERRARAALPPLAGST
jgi:predicted PurR-regulated permease PerM